MCVPIVPKTFNRSFVIDIVTLLQTNVSLLVTCQTNALILKHVEEGVCFDSTKAVV